MTTDGQFLEGHTRTFSINCGLGRQGLCRDQYCMDYLTELQENDEDLSKSILLHGRQSSALSYITQAPSFRTLKGC